MIIFNRTIIVKIISQIQNKIQYRKIEIVNKINQIKNKILMKIAKINPHRNSWRLRIMQ